MPSFVGSQGAALVTAVLVSGTLILLLLRPKRIIEADRAPSSTVGDKKKGKLTSKARRVRFARDVVEPTGDNEEHRRRRGIVAWRLSHRCRQGRREFAPMQHRRTAAQLYQKEGKMPENHVVLYNGILRDRLQRMATQY